MKVSHVRSARATAMFRLFPILVFSLGVSLAPPLHAISLTGANGKAVEFHLIKSATPKGITAQMVPDGPVIGITWEKLDLAALERDHKAIHDAFLRSKQGETVELNLGKEAPAAMPDPAVGAKPASNAPPPERFPGWIEAKVGSFNFTLQLPSEPAKGILLVSVDDFGRSFEQLAGHQRGSGTWGVFQSKLDFALLSYDVSRGDKAMDPTVIDDFVFAGKGSGKVLEAAIKDLATKAKQPTLADLPIAIYGAERTGAAFAYNLVQYRPERIVAAVVIKGAFYDDAPTPASAAVPLLLIWGEYSNDHEIWKSENHAEAVLAKAASLNPNWTNGREFRGQGELNLVVEHFGRQYLMEMVKQRLSDKPATPAPASEPKVGEEGKPSEGGVTKTDAPSGGADSTASSEGKFGITPIDRAKGSKGNVETGEVTKITDPNAPLTEEETFLPNDAVAKLWKAFVLGELEAPAPSQPPQ